MKLALVPARGGSRRIANKNALDFFGRPMLAYPLAAARDAALFDKIHVSTESAAIADTAAALGFAPEFRRPADLARDDTPLMPVLRWVLSAYRERGETYDTVCVLLPCAPLIEARDLVQAHEAFATARRPLMAVCAYPAPIEWAYARAADGTLAPVQPGAYATRSQDLAVRYFDAGAFYFFDAAHILSEAPASDRDFTSYLLPRSRSVDIDNEEDLELARVLFRGLRRGD